MALPSPPLSHCPSVIHLSSGLHSPSNLCLDKPFFLHRRLLHDDAFGVGEALNETAFGVGLVARGKHRYNKGELKKLSILLQGTGRRQYIYTYTIVRLSKSFIFLALKSFFPWMIFFYLY